MNRDGLTVLVGPEVPPQLVVDLLSALDALHRAYGGGGLNVTVASTRDEYAGLYENARRWAMHHPDALADFDAMWPKPKQGGDDAEAR